MTSCLLWRYFLVVLGEKRHYQEYLTRDYPRNYCRSTFGSEPWCYVPPMGFQDTPDTREVCNITNCECPRGRFGENCRLDCHCNNETELCDNWTGHCDSGCAQGWSGQGCQFSQDECPQGRFGESCRLKCHCRDETEICDNWTGHCDSGCAQGWGGTSCQVELPRLSTAPRVERGDVKADLITLSWNPLGVSRGDTGYGPALQYRLHVQGGKFSRHTPVGKLAHKGCHNSLYERFCSSTIDNLEPETNYSVYVTTMSKDGEGPPGPSLHVRTCPNLTAPAINITDTFFNETSLKAAMTVTWPSPLEPIDPSQRREYIVFLVLDGWYKKRVGRTPDPGITIRNLTPSTEYCVTVHMELPSGCASPDSAIECALMPEIVCPQGRFGENCRLECHCRDGAEPCNIRTGHCKSGCARGWTGASCQSECPRGRFGENCSLECHCLDKAEICDNRTGHCVSGCAKGWTGESCQSELPRLSAAPTASPGGVGADHIILTWRPWGQSRDNRPDVEYMLYVRGGKLNRYTQVGNMSTSACGYNCSFTIKDLTPRTSYSVYITILSENGEGRPGPSLQVQTECQNLTAPYPFIIDKVLDETSMKAAMIVTWLNPLEPIDPDERVQYFIWLAYDSHSEVYATVTGPPVTISNLLPSKEYCVTIHIELASGCASPNSTVNCAHMPEADPTHLVCLQGRFGEKCNLECHCWDKAEVCNSRTGHCKSGCAQGWTGANCQIELPRLSTAPRVRPFDVRADRITLSWNSWGQSRGDTGHGPVVQYRLYVRRGKFGHLTRVGNFPPSCDYFCRNTITRLEPGTDYSVYITAVSKDGEGPPGPSLHVRTCPDLTAPAISITDTFLDKTSINAAMTVKWLYPVVDPDERAKYIVSLVYESHQQVYATVTDQTVTIWNLLPSTKYCVTVHAELASGCAGPDSTVECAHMPEAAFSRCLDPVDKKKCQKKVKRYFYDTIAKSCRRFWYGGCGRSGNLFPRRKNCVAVCGILMKDDFFVNNPNIKPTDVRKECLVPVEDETCNKTPAQTYYHYSLEQRSCLPFTYRGCTDVTNRFSTKKTCKEFCLMHKRTYATKSFQRNLCRLDPDAGQECRPGSGKETRLRRFYYDWKTQTCKTFSYRGCNGNHNRFKNRSRCRKFCTPTD